MYIFTSCGQLKKIVKFVSRDGFNCTEYRDTYCPLKREFGRSERCIGSYKIISNCTTVYEVQQVAQVIWKGCQGNSQELHEGSLYSA